MGLLDQAAAQTDVADLIILANVETKCDRMQSATASAVAAMIGGAPVSDVSQRLQRLWNLGLVHPPMLHPFGYQLTPMGVELLRMELEGWSPSRREEERRNSELRTAAMRRTGS